MDVVQNSVEHSQIPQCKPYSEIQILITSINN